MPVNNIPAPTDYNLQAQQIERARQYAQALQQQEAPQGQQVGMFYAAPSWTQHLNKLASQLGGAYMERQADDRQKALSQQMQGDFRQWAEGLSQPMDKKQMLAQALSGMQNPMAAPIAQQFLAQAIAPVKWEFKEGHDAKGNKVLLAVNPQNPSQFQQVGGASAGDSEIARQMAILNDPNAPPAAREFAQNYLNAQSGGVRARDRFTQDWDRYKYENPSAYQQQQLFQGEQGLRLRAQGLGLQAAGLQQGNQRLQYETGQPGVPIPSVGLPRLGAMPPQGAPAAPVAASAPAQPVPVMPQQRPAMPPQMPPQGVPQPGMPGQAPAVPQQSVAPGLPPSLRNLPPKEQAAAQRAAFESDQKALEKEAEGVANANKVKAQIQRFIELNKLSPGSTGVVMGNLPNFSTNAQQMAQIENDLGMNNFKPGQGSISNYERSMNVGANVSQKYDLAANQNIAKIQIGAVENLSDRQQFRQAWLAQKGNLLGSDEAWQQYLDANPRYRSNDSGKTLMDNRDRVSWQDWFYKGARPSWTPGQTKQRGSSGSWNEGAEPRVVDFNSLSRGR